jgi:hypothetical protein
MRFLKRNRGSVPDHPITFYIPEHQVEHVSFSDMDLGPRLEELIRIGRSSGYVGSPGGPFDEHHNNIRAREIGDAYNKIGGMDLMLEVHARVVRSLGPVKGRELEACWGGVGAWMR